jgi:hypothetical protein
MGSKKPHTAKHMSVRTRFLVLLVLLLLLLSLPLLLLRRVDLHSV